MSMTMLTVIQIVQALAAYSFVMLFLPWVFLREYLAHFELSERIIGYFLTGNFYIIYLVFLLQFLHISNSITLWIGTLFPFLVMVIRQGKLNSVREWIVSFLKTFLHILKGEIGIKTLLFSQWRKFFKKYGKAIRTQLFRCFPDLVFMGLIVAGVCYVYGYNVVTVFGYKASDVPVHNLWINNMSNNQIFSKGVYPYGFHCVIYYLHTVFGIKTYILLRVFGLVQTLFIHLALLISLKVICKARYTPYFGTAAYLMLKIYSPGSYVRFLSALPQEYGMLFIFPAAVLAIRFFQEYTKQRSEQEIEKKQWRAKRVKGYLAGFAISFSLTLTAHFYDTIPAGVLCVGIAVGFFRMLFKWRYFWRIMLAGIISVVLALVPMVAGVITGHPLEGSLYWALGVISGEENSSQGQNNDNVTTVIDKNGNEITIVGQIDEETLQRIINGGEDETNESKKENSEEVSKSIDEITETPKEPSKIQKVLSVVKSKLIIIFGRIRENCANMGNVTTAIMLAAICFLFLFGMIAIIRKQKEYGYILCSFAVFMVMMCILQSLSALGLPELMQQYRVCIFFCYSMGAVWALNTDAVVFLLADLLKKKQILEIGSALMIMTAVFVSIQENLTRLPATMYAMETNESILCLTEIMHENKDLTWTVVSANDERQMIADTGWHYEMITFLRQLKDLEENSIITIPTEYVYFFIEKRPVNIDEDGVVSSERLQNVSEEGALQPVSLKSGIKPYHGEDRWGTMSHMYYWAQAFKKLYPQEMEVYYETTDFVCYRLHQNVNSLYNLAIDYGYNDPHETDINSDETLDLLSETSNRTSDIDLAPVLETQSNTDSKEELNGFAQKLRSYYDYYGDRLFSISTSEYGEGKLE